jgi:hypothetical protein
MTAKLIKYEILNIEDLWEYLTDSQNLKEDEVEILLNSQLDFAA